MNLFCKGQKALSLKGKSNIDRIFKKGKYKEVKKETDTFFKKLDQELKKIARENLSNDTDKFLKKLDKFEKMSRKNKSIIVK